MNIKNISIVLTVLLVAIAVFVFMQKGNYVDQATSHYTEETGKTFSKTNEIIGNVNNSVNVNKAVWTLVCKTIETAKSSKDQATLEAKYVPSVKGSNSHRRQTVDFIDEQDIVRLQIGEQTRQIAGFVNHGTGSDTHVHAHLVADDVRQSSLAQSRRPVQQDVVQCLATTFGRVYKDHQIFQHLLLSLELSKLRRTNGALEFLVRGRQVLSCRIQILVHALNVEVCPNG